MAKRINLINPALNYGSMASARQKANIKCAHSTRDTLRGLKRGGESYDELLQKMAEQYDPDSAREDND